MTEIDTRTAAIEALMDGVTAGPWEQDGPISAKIVWAGPDVRVCFMTSDGPASKNARFIAAARELVPALAAERDAAVARAERAEARAAELEADVEQLRDRVQTLGTEGHAYHAGRTAAAEIWHAERDSMKAEVERLRVLLRNARERNWIDFEENRDNEEYLVCVPTLVKLNADIDAALKGGANG